MSKLHALALAHTVAAGNASSAQLEQCTQESSGYQRFPATSMLPALSETCQWNVTHILKLHTSASFGKARLNGKDTWDMNQAELAPVVANLHTQARQTIDTVIQEEWAALVSGGKTKVNVSGTIQGPATPDMNLRGWTLKTAAGISSTYWLYRVTPEITKTAGLRCDALLSGIPTELTISGKKVDVTSNRLDCVPTPKVLDISKWAGDLTALWAELIDLGMIPPKSWDEAQVFAVKNANNPTLIPSHLSPQSKETIAKLAKEFDAMRVVPMNGTLGVTVTVNKTDYHVWTMAGYATVIALAGLIIGGGLMAYGKRNRGMRIHRA